MVEELSQPTSELARAIGPAASPFLPRHLVDLFVRPSRFFAGQVALGKTPYALLVTWVLGMKSAIDRIDTQMVRADWAADSTRWEAIELLVGTWPRFWTAVVLFGLLSGALHWWLGGWWCKMRLRWSGATAPDPRQARLLLVYSSFVFAGPAVLSTLIQTALYPDYLVAYEEEFLFTFAVIAMVMWSVVTTYKGATAMFDVRSGLALLWFVVLPVCFFLIVMGGAAVLLAAAA